MREEINHKMQSHHYPREYQQCTAGLYKFGGLDGLIELDEFCGGGWTKLEKAEAT